MLFEHGDAHFLGAAWVNGGFVNHYSPRLHHLAYGFAGLDQRRQVGAVGLVDGGGHRDDEHAAFAQVLGVAAVAQKASRLQVLRRDFQGRILAGLQLGNARLADVKADYGALFAKLYGQWQTNIA